MMFLYPQQAFLNQCSSLGTIKHKKRTTSQFSQELKTSTILDARERGYFITHTGCLRALGLKSLKEPHN